MFRGRFNTYTYRGRGNGGGNRGYSQGGTLGGTFNNRKHNNKDNDKGWEYDKAIKRQFLTLTGWKDWFQWESAIYRHIISDIDDDAIKIIEDPNFLTPIRVFRARPQQLTVASGVNQQDIDQRDAEIAIWETENKASEIAHQAEILKRKKWNVKVYSLIEQHLSYAVKQAINADSATGSARQLYYYLNNMYGPGNAKNGESLRQSFQYVQYFDNQDPVAYCDNLRALHNRLLRFGLNTLTTEQQLTRHAVDRISACKKRPYTAGSTALTDLAKEYAKGNLKSLLDLQEFMQVQHLANEQFHLTDAVTAVTAQFHHTFTAPAAGYTFNALRGRGGGDGGGRGRGRGRGANNNFNPNQRGRGTIRGNFRGATANRGRGGSHGHQPYPTNAASITEDQCAYCFNQGHWKNECPDAIAGSPAHPNSSWYNPSTAIAQTHGAPSTQYGAHPFSNIQPFNTSNYSSSSSAPPLPMYPPFYMPHQFAAIMPPPPPPPTQPTGPTPPHLRNARSSGTHHINNIVIYTLTVVGTAIYKLFNTRTIKQHQVRHLLDPGSPFSITPLQSDFDNGITYTLNEPIVIGGPLANGGKALITEWGHVTLKTDLGSIITIPMYHAPMSHSRIVARSTLAEIGLRISDLDTYGPAGLYRVMFGFPITKAATIIEEDGYWFLDLEHTHNHITHMTQPDFQMRL